MFILCFQLEYKSEMNTHITTLHIYWRNTPSDWINRTNGDQIVCLKTRGLETGPLKLRTWVLTWHMWLEWLERCWFCVFKCNINRKFPSLLPYLSIGETRLWLDTLGLSDSSYDLHFIKIKLCGYNNVPRLGLDWTGPIENDLGLTPYLKVKTWGLHMCDW